MTPISDMVGANRTVQGNGIVHPLGDAQASAAQEHALRRRLIERALDALRTPVDAPTLFR